MCLILTPCIQIHNPINNLISSYIFNIVSEKKKWNSRIKNIRSTQEQINLITENAL